MGCTLMEPDVCIMYSLTIWGGLELDNWCEQWDEDEISPLDPCSKNKDLSLEMMRKCIQMNRSVK